MVLGLAGFGLVYIFHRIGTSEWWISATAIVSGCLIALTKPLEFTEAYYNHYVSEGVKPDTANFPDEKAGGK
jgi:hypothetical protein